MPPQSYLQNGNLTPGIHSYKMQEFEQQFVKDFTSSISRSKIYNNFTEWMEKLLSIVPPRYIWLDGSFLTQKVDPNDIDLVVFYYPEDIPDEQQANQLKDMINVVSRSYDCDAYLCLSFEQWEPERVAQIPNQNVTIMQTYWQGQFGFDRSRQPKGMVHIDQQELLSKIGGAIS